LKRRARSSRAVAVVGGLFADLGDEARISSRSAWTQALWRAASQAVGRPVRAVCGTLVGAMVAGAASSWRY
jgi:hypothetical protein